MDLKKLIQNSLILAPLAGITDYAMRVVCRDLGADLAYSEMVSAQALVRNKSKTLLLLHGCKEEYPSIIQLFGREPEVMANAAKIAVEYGADVIDINMGCSVPKIVKSGSGAALLDDLPQVSLIIREMRKSVNVPITVKTRLNKGFEIEPVVELAQRAADEGASAIAFHPRTRAQKFTGEAKWEYIAKLKQTTTLPVIASGDINTPQDLEKIRIMTGCDAVMIGRAALGNPWIFGKLKGLIKGEIPWEEKSLVITKHLNMLRDIYGDERSLYHSRKHLIWYTKGLPGAKAWREKVFKIETWSEVIEEIMKIELNYYKK